MGELTTQKRQLLVKAIRSLHAAWKQAIADGPCPGERVKVTVGADEVLGRVLYRGPNNVGYVQITGSGDVVGSGVPRHRAPHADVRRLSLPKEQFTEEQALELANKLDLPYGAKQLKFEIIRTRGEMQDELGR